MTQNLIYGDHLLRKKGPVLHIGVYLIKGVAHIYPGAVLEIGTIEEFSQDQPFRVIRKNDIKYDGVMERFWELSMKAAPYRLLGNNCEHNAHYLLHGQKASPQLQTFLLTAPVGAILARKHGWLGVLLGGIAMGAAGVTMYNASRQYSF